MAKFLCERDEQVFIEANCDSCARGQGDAKCTVRRLQSQWNGGMTKDRAFALDLLVPQVGNDAELAACSMWVGIDGHIR